MNKLTGTSSQSVRAEFTLRLPRSIILLLCIGLTMVSSAALSATDEVGKLAIDGAVIPAGLVAHSFIGTSRNADRCSPSAIKDRIIDMIVATRQQEIDTGVNVGKNRAVLEEFGASFTNIRADGAYEITKDLIEELQKNLSSFIRLNGVDVTEQDLYDEYRIRVRDKDPKVVDVTVVRVLEIKRTIGPDWDDKLIEQATDIKQGMSFEEVAARYPSQHTIDYQTDRWVLLDSLPHDIDKTQVKAGDVYGIEKILQEVEFYHPMVKIYEVKVLSQIRPSDRLYSGNEFRGYLRNYLIEKARQRKRHEFMSQQWTNFEITEDGKPLQRVGVYQPCE